jgi:hypothetical protein
MKIHKLTKSKLLLKSSVNVPLSVKKTLMTNYGAKSSQKYSGYVVGVQHLNHIVQLLKQHKIRTTIDPALKPKKTSKTTKATKATKNISLVVKNKFPFPKNPTNSEFKFYLSLLKQKPNSPMAKAFHNKFCKNDRFKNKCVHYN